MTTATMSPIQTIESVYEAFSRGDIAHIVGLVAKDATWHQSSYTPWGGNYVGPEGATHFFQKLDAACQTTGFVVRDSVAAGNEVFSFGRDHGYYGRILSQTVISTPTLAVADKGREIVGFCRGTCVKMSKPSATRMP